MSRFATRLLFAACILFLGLAIGYFLGNVKFKLKPKPEEIATQSGWQEIDLDGKASFSIPRGLRKVFREAPKPYRDFRSENLEIFIYQQSLGAPTCQEYAETLARKDRISNVSIGDRQAILQDIGETTFDIEANEPILKGFIICVPEIGGTGMIVVGKYKTQQDYDVLRKIIESVEFHEV